MVGYHEWVDAATGLVVWVSSGAGDALVLPDANADLMLWNGGLHVAGYDTIGHRFDRGAGQRTIGVRLHAGWLPTLLNDSARAAADARVPLGGSADRLLELADRDPREAATMLANAARALYADSASDSATGTAARLLAESLGRGQRVSAVAEALEWSPRRVHRFCLEVFGLPPSQLRSAARFHRANRMLATGMPPAQVAAAAGYADQAHLTREVRRISGLTPHGLHPQQTATPPLSAD